MKPDSSPLCICTLQLKTPRRNTRAKQLNQLWNHKKKFRFARKLWTTQQTQTQIQFTHKNKTANHEPKRQRKHRFVSFRVKYGDDLVKIVGQRVRPKQTSTQQRELHCTTQTRHAQ